MRYDGAADALDGSARTPTPQGFASPFGCVALAGAVVVPSAAAIAKRPVQVRFAGAAGVENW